MNKLDCLFWTSSLDLNLLSLNMDLSQFFNHHLRIHMPPLCSNCYLKEWFLEIKQPQQSTRTFMGITDCSELILQQEWYARSWVGSWIKWIIYLLDERQCFVVFVIGFGFQEKNDLKKLCSDESFWDH